MITTLLAGDIGGTKTLLSLYSWDGTTLELCREERFVSGQWDDLAPMVQHFLSDPDSQGPAAACLAVATPVPSGPGIGMPYVGSNSQASPPAMTAGIQARSPPRSRSPVASITPSSPACRSSSRKIHARCAGLARPDSPAVTARFLLLRAASLRLPVSEGVLITGVLQDGPASRSGMRLAASGI